MNRKNYTFLCGAVFLVIMLFHLFRIILGWEVNINGVEIPVQFSLFASGIAAGLAFLGLGLSKS